MLNPVKCNYKNLRDLLQSKESLSAEQRLQLRQSIDEDGECWKIWNKIRWDLASKSLGVEELKIYLGSEFIPYFDSSWALSREWKSKSRNTKNSIEEFYKNTKNYIYNSVIFYESGDRLDLRPYFLELKSRFEISSVIDFGCGVGNDGLFMIEGGSKVFFVDFDSPTLDFLRWRLNKRKIEEKRFQMVDVKSSSLNNIAADMFWSIDVLEHMKNPMEFFDCISNSTRVIVYFTDADDKAKGRHPFHFKINHDAVSAELEKKGYISSPHPVLNVWVKKN